MSTRWLLRISIGLGSVAAFAMIATAALMLLLGSDRFRNELEIALGDATGREVRVGGLALSPLSGSVVVRDLSIADDGSFSSEPFLTARHVRVDVALQPLLRSQKLVITGVHIASPAISLVQTATGLWNFSSLGASARPSAATPNLDLTVRSLHIEGGTLSLRRGGSTTPQVLEKFALEVHDFSPSTSFPFSIHAGIRGDGDVQLTGSAGPIVAHDAASTPFSTQLTLAQLDVINSGFVHKETGLSALVNLSASAESDGAQITLAGTLTAEKWKLDRRGRPAPKSIALSFDVLHDAKARAGELRNGSVQLGRASGELKGQYRGEGERTNLDLWFKSRAMPVDDLEAALPALAITLPAGSSLSGGSMHTTLHVHGPADALISEGSLSVEHVRLRHFDLGDKLSAAAKVAGLQVGTDTTFESIAAHVRDTPHGTALRGIAISAAGIGKISGEGTLSSSDALHFDMQARLSTARGVLGALGSKDTLVPFRIVGTASNPVFEADIKAAAKDVAANAAGHAKEVAVDTTAKTTGFARQKFASAADGTKNAAGKVIGLFRRNKP